ncbi:MAG: tetratricopeptide repeat protein [Saprospiraceae bacterium]|nr:tetratricopeptide repeat protein [Saprospiraceae bacterium]
MQYKYLLILSFGAFILSGLQEVYSQIPSSSESSEVNLHWDSLIDVTRQQKETTTIEARKTLDRLRGLVEGTSSRHYLAQLQLLEGEILLEENLADRGLAKVTQAQSLFESSRDKPGLANVEDALTKYYLRSAQYAKALTHVFQGIELKEELNDIRGLALSLIDVADIYWYYQRFSESIEYANKALKLIEDLGASNELAAVYKILSESYLEIPDYDLALFYIEKAIEVKRQLDATPLQLAAVINSRGNVFKYLNRYDDAIADYSEVLRICDSADYRIGVRASSANLGHVYLLKKDYKRVINYKLQSLEIQKESGQIQQQAENVMHLSEAYAGLGMFDSAYLYHVILDSIKGMEHAQALDKLTNELSVKYDTEKKEQAIASLNEKVRLQSLSMILGSALLALSLIAVFVFLRLNNQLKAKNRENVILLKEIHHRVKNNLQILSSLLSLQTDHLVDANAIDALTEGKNRVESMSMIHQRLYSGSDITSVDLKDYIGNLCRYLEDAFSGTFKVIRIEDRVKYESMDVDFAIPLGLIINELVTNAVKYAFTDRSEGTLTIDLFEEGTELFLIVADDGQVLLHSSSEAISTSFGSRLIETLSKKLKGEIKIDLSHGYSTRIKFTRYKKDD